MNRKTKRNCDYKFTKLTFAADLKKSKKVYNKEQLLKDYIKFYATADVQTRGKSLFEKDAVTFVDYIDKSDKWDFTVQGSKEYKGFLEKSFKVGNYMLSIPCGLKVGRNWGEMK